MLTYLGIALVAFVIGAVGVGRYLRVNPDKIPDSFKEAVTKLEARQKAAVNAQTPVDPDDTLIVTPVIRDNPTKPSQNTAQSAATRRSDVTTSPAETSPSPKKGRASAQSTSPVREQSNQERREALRERMSSQTTEEIAPRQRRNDEGSSGSRSENRRTRSAPPLTEARRPKARPAEKEEGLPRQPRRQSDSTSTSNGATSNGIQRSETVDN